MSGAASYYGEGGRAGTYGAGLSIGPFPGQNGLVPGSGGGSVGYSSVTAGGYSGGAGAFAWGLYVLTPGTSFPYQIPQPGAGGTAAGAPSGGPGAQGQIIIREYYA